jgi:hypothetical protein
MEWYPPKGLRHRVATAEGRAVSRLSHGVRHAPFASEQPTEFAIAATKTRSDHHPERCRTIGNMPFGTITFNRPDGVGDPQRAGSSLVAFATECRKCLPLNTASSATETATPVAETLNQTVCEIAVPIRPVCAKTAPRLFLL